MKKIFFNVSCLVLLVTGVLACSGQGKKDKESAATEHHKPYQTDATPLY